MAKLADCPIPFQIESETASVLAEAGRRTIPMVFSTSAADYGDFVDFASGKPGMPGVRETINGVGRDLPLRHPTQTRMFATRIRTEGYTPGQSPGCNPPYSGVRIYTDFSMMPFKVEGVGAFYKKRRLLGGIYANHPASAYHYSAAMAARRDLGTFTPTLGYAVSSYYADDDEDSAAADLLGSVNDGTFLGKQTGHLLFAGLLSDDMDGLGGVQAIVKTFVFLYLTHEWNESMRHDGAWDVALNRNDNEHQYPSGDFNLILPGYTTTG
jgi:hypothetical protein